MKTNLRKCSYVIVSAFLLSLSPYILFASNCEYYLNNGPILRSTGFNEEHLVNGMYSGFAQRYNGLSGQMTGIRFWARSTSTAQSIKVTMYQENVGFPGVILAQTTTSVPYNATCQQIDALFPASINVNGNVVLSIEPTSSSTNDIWVQHNLEGNALNNYVGDGDNLFLNLVRQGVTWYKDLANGDPSWDYDFMILPIRSFDITPAFSFTSNNLTASFTNTSINASSYSWDFGDGSVSTQTNPAHTYATAGTYQVVLIASGPATSGCVDSVIQSVSVLNTSIGELSDLIVGPRFDANVGQLYLLSLVNQSFVVYSMEGKCVDSFVCARNESVVRQLQELSPGIYYLRSSLSSGYFKFAVNH